MPSSSPTPEMSLYSPFCKGIMLPPSSLYGYVFISRNTDILLPPTPHKHVFINPKETCCHPPGVWTTPGRIITNPGIKACLLFPTSTYPYPGYVFTLYKPPPKVTPLPRHVFTHLPPTYPHTDMSP